MGREHELRLDIRQGAAGVAVQAKAGSKGDEGSCRASMHNGI